MTTNIVFI